MQKRAAVWLPDSPSYRRGLFRQGLERLGYAVEDRPLSSPRPGDVLVMWNRRAHDDHVGKMYERAGATVLVAENGYINFAPGGERPLALARRYHNGAGEWRVGPTRRWLTGLAPWRSGGDFILLLPQRGIGPQGVAMPRDWAMNAAAKLRKAMGRPIKIRPHPGNTKAEPDEALRGAWAAATWGSGAAIKALALGYPVFHDFDRWIGAPASVQLRGADIEKPFLGDRLPMFERLAWAQWTGDEIASGEAFAWLLRS